MEIIIRNAKLSDAAAIAQLLIQLTYIHSADFIASKLQQFAQDPNVMTWVAENQQNVCAVLSLNLIPQLAVAGHFARISYLCVDELSRSQRIGEQLLQVAEAYAREHGCDRMELHCHQRRVAAHQFYVKHGYEDSPQYFRKDLSL